jgi:hypothetical protein
MARVRARVLDVSKTLRLVFAGARTRTGSLYLGLVVASRLLPISNGIMVQRRGMA